MTKNQFAEVVEDFSILDDWEDRYRYVIELGKQMPEMSEQEKNNNTKVNGCASQVWLLPQVEYIDEKQVFFLSGDSDALIVKGLVAILIKLYSGVELSDAEKIDALSEFKKLGLDQHLSAQRSNGLRSMVELIKLNLRTANENKIK